MLRSVRILIAFAVSELYVTAIEINFRKHEFISRRKATLFSAKMHIGKFDVLHNGMFTGSQVYPTNPFQASLLISTYNRKADKLPGHVWLKGIHFWGRPNYQSFSQFSDRICRKFRYVNKNCLLSH